MAFFRQLKLLLWKNWLTVIRQPVWSATLVVWPLAIFVIIAVTRYHFPPVVSNACYVEPRNLPSAGFFPFLQTLMCNTDSTCHNKSRLVDPASSTSSQRNQRNGRKSLLKSSPLAELFQGNFKFSFPTDSSSDPTALIEVLNNIVGMLSSVTDSSMSGHRTFMLPSQSQHGASSGVSFMNTTNTTFPDDKETLNTLLESMNLLKRAICSLALPMINTTSLSPLSYAAFTFCKSNSTLFEVSLETLNKILMQLMMTNPDEMATLIAEAALVFDQLQNEKSLWESLLAIPKVFSSGSLDQMLSSTETLLVNIHKALSVIQSNFPEAGDSLSSVHPSLVGGISVLRYVQNWPGRDVTISLRDVIVFNNDSFAALVKDILQIQIPLDKAIALALDRDMAHHYLCVNSNNAIWLQGLCSAGVVSTVLERISPELVAKQTFLAWSKHVARHDISFARGLLHSLMGGSSPGGPGGSTRDRRSVDTQQQNIDEELFLEMGQVVMEIIEFVPGADEPVQRVLGTAFEYMKAATLTLDTVNEFIANVMKDADGLQRTYLMLLKNQPGASTWVAQVMDSVLGEITKSLTSENSTCKDILSSFEWLLNTSSVSIEMWRSVICQNDSALQQTLMDLQRFFQKPLEMTNYNFTLPMILSEWHKLYNNSVQFGMLLERLETQLGGAYWMNWMPEDSNNDLTGTLQQSAYLFMVKLGERIEKSQQWSEMRTYFHMAFWVLNYRPGFTSQPANCSASIYTLAVQCDTGFNWPQFVQAVSQALMSPNQDILLNSLQGTMNLLQHVYGDIAKYMAESYLNQIQGADALSAYLTHLLHNMDAFLRNISELPVEKISDPNVMTPLVSHLLQSTGLSPLLPLLLSDQPLSVSTVLDVASKIGRLNQHIFNISDTDPAMAELEGLIRQFFSLTGNLTVSLSHIMGNTLLTYYGYFHPDDVARLRKAIEPFINQTSAGVVEAILTAMELLQTVMDSPNADPTHVILEYLRQLQNFLMSLFRVQQVQHILSSTGEMGTAQVTDLYEVSKEFFSLLTPESLQNLTQAGPDAAQDIVIQRLVALLPLEVQERAKHVLQDFKALQYHLAKCAAGQNCLAGVSETFSFLNQILDLMLLGNGSVTISVAASSSALGGQGFEDISLTFFPFLLSSNDSVYVETFRRILYFVRLLMATSNINVSDVQSALRQSNLTLEELNYITSIVGAANVTELMENVMKIINAQQCFAQQPNPVVCVLEVIKVVSDFLAHLPALRNEKAIISLISQIAKNTIINALQQNVPINSTLANVTMSLQQNNLITPEIMKEIRVLEGLIQLAISPLPFNDTLNSTSLDPISVQVVYLEMIDWYLKRVINITSSSSVSELLGPFFYLTQMQVTLQLAQTNLSLYVSNQVEFLMNNLQYPIGAVEISSIGQTAIEILRHLVDQIILNLKLQNNIPGFPPLHNTTALHAMELHVKLYLDLIEKWMKQPDVPLVLSSMLQWGNPTINISTPATDFQHLLGTVGNIVSDDQQAYLHIIENITQSLRKALMIAEQPGGLQSDHFLAAVLEAIQMPVQILTNFTLPPSDRQNILEIARYALKLFVQPNMSYASSQNISLIILKRAQGIIQRNAPANLRVYLMWGTEIAATYFETVSTTNGPYFINHIILNVMKTVQALLPPNSPAQAYISVLININQLILGSGQGNMSVLDLGIGTVQELSVIFAKLMAGEADQNTWDRLEKTLEAFLSRFHGTELWDTVLSVITQSEKIIASMVKTRQAETEMIQSLLVAVGTLMREIAQSVNTTDFDLSEVSEKMQLAIEQTVRAAEQANGTLNCSDILPIWEPVKRAAGLNRTTMGMWCNINLQPVLESYYAAAMVYSHLSTSHMGAGPMTANATAARIIRTVQALYQANVNSSLVIQQFIMTFSNQVYMLTGRPLSPEAQLHWFIVLQNMTLQDSLDSFRLLSQALLHLDPSLQPHIDAIERALMHILRNSNLMQNSSSPQDLFREAAMIFLSNYSPQSSELNKTVVADLVREAVQMMIDMEIFGDAAMVYQALEHFLASNGTDVLAQKLIEMFEFLASSEAFGLDLLTQALGKVYEIFSPLLSVLTQSIHMPALAELFEDLAGNISALLNQLLSTDDLLSTMEDYGWAMSEDKRTGSDHIARGRKRREATMLPPRSPVDDFIDLFYIDYPAMFRAMAVRPTTAEIMETAHVFISNPDLNFLVKGAADGMRWGLNASQEDTIDAALGVASFLTLPNAAQMSSMHLLMHAVDQIPDGIPFSSVIKNITRALVKESQENLIVMQQTVGTVAELFQISLTDDRFSKELDHLKSQVCALENTESVRLMVQALSMEPGQLCHTYLPSLQILAEALMMNISSLTDAVLQAIFGDPRTYNVHSDWTTALSEGLGFNTSSLSSLNINITSPGEITVGEMLWNKTAFIADVQQHTDFEPAALQLLLGATLPNRNSEILAWLINLRHCSSTPPEDMEETDEVILKAFCSMSAEQWYSLSILMARHLNIEKVIYRMVLSEEVQSLIALMLQVAKVLTTVMDRVLPIMGQLQGYMQSLSDLNLMSANEFNLMMRGQRRSISSKATFVTLSRALCSNGILALFGLSQVPMVLESSPSFDHPQKEEMIEKFKIPRNATPFCQNMYLDMVNTTGGAIAWAFLKPMLMGQILFTPNTPTTRAIMEKTNTILLEFANLRKHSQDWIESSNYIMDSAQLLSQTLPILQNSLGNSFVKNFIEMQTDIDVGKMRETLNNFSNVTVMLEKNKHILNQITTLSRLMVDLSSCIKFDRYRGYDSAEQLDAVALDLAKNRELYASIIFKLPQDEDRDSSTSTLPPKVSYTIRMHMDNVMRTDRVRNPYFIRHSHISLTRTMRYNRGFVYLQENIDRAIIETQVGQKVAEPAVQLQPFPYPCNIRDEYLEAISYVFPLVLMMAWVLFIADFVQKLVHERELRLHEYMKMMGVNPLSHFFAWFLECAAYLVLTIFILTLLLKYGAILPKSDGFLLFLYLCDYGLSILAFSYMISTFFDKTYIAGLSGSLIYILCFFPFIVVMAVETGLTFSQKSVLSLFSPTCFSYASQYVSRYEAQAEGIQWSNSYSSPLTGDTASFGWLCWLMLIDSILYFLVGAYIRMVFPGKYGIPAPWYFPFKASFWADLCGCVKSNSRVGRGLLFTNVMQKNRPVFNDDKGKGQSAFSYQTGEELSELPVGVTLFGLTKIYGDRVAIENLNVSFYEGQITSLLGHNGAGKTTTMSLLTGLFPPSSGSIEVYGRDMQSNIDDVRKELGVCMQYDVLFDHMTTKEHLLLYGQIKAPHWSQRELREQVRTILEETGMYTHRHKRVGTLSGGMKRKLSISIAFIGGSRLVVLDEPTTGVDPCSRRSIWDIVIQHKKNCTIIMSTHHLDEAEVLSDRIAFLERGGLKCCGSPFYLKDKLGQGYKLTLTKKMQKTESEEIDNAELKCFIQAHVPEAHLKEAQGSDQVYSLPPFSMSNASAYRSLLTALDSNLDDLQLGGYSISDTTLEEVFLQMTEEANEDDGLLSISKTVSDTESISSFSSDLSGSTSGFGDNIKLTSPSTVSGMALVWQQMTAILIKRFHHSRRDWKGLISQILLPVLFVMFAMGLGAIKSDMEHYPEMELSPALYKFSPSYSFFSNQNAGSSRLTDTMMSFPGIDNACLEKSDDPACTKSTNKWSIGGNSSKGFNVCRCTPKQQICEANNFQPPHKKIPSSQIVYNLSGINVENYLVATANDFIRNRYGGFSFGMSLPPDLRLDISAVPKNRTLSKVWFNPEGHHTMPAYLNSLNNFILRSNLPKDKDPHEYAISVSSHPYFARADEEDFIIQGMLHILVAMCVLTGYSITTASFAVYEVNEHHSGSKRLQHIAGISEPFYWTMNFCFDMFMYLIPVTMTIGVIAAFQIPAFTDRQNLGAIALLLVLFGFATFPWMYLLSGLFKDAEMAFITYVCINLFISVNTILSTSVLYFMGQISIHNAKLIQDIFTKLGQAFLIFPQFNFGNGFMQLARKNIEVQILSGYGIDVYQNPFSLDSMGWLFIASFIEGVVLFTFRLLLNKALIRKVRHLICGRKVVHHVASEDEDEDVAAEHLRVSSGAASSDILQVNQLTKVYQHLKKKIYAVKSLSVGIPAGECFGLLGVNGAGKTTTFKMLTGDVSPTDGTAQIRDWAGRLVDIMDCRSKGINIGYCPQVDALDNLLTGEEHLYFYGRIRGISQRELHGVVNYLLKRLELSYHKNIITDGYSCGTRRKLSTALALIGHPQILLLDEPSSGMDPRTKRHLWKIISQEVKGKCAVVLTSHSMEECEALCSRLAIMVKGQFQCLGSLQHIKNRFGSGFTVKMYLTRALCDTETITGFMQRRFPSTYLKDHHSTMLEYHVPIAPGGVADIFDQLESNKNSLQIKHFSVSQTTLDEVFINFALGNIGTENKSISEDDTEGLDAINAAEESS